jgi:hypothetical protein
MLLRGSSGSGETDGWWKPNGTVIVGPLSLEQQTMFSWAAAVAGLHASVEGNMFRLSLSAATTVSSPTASIDATIPTNNGVISAIGGQAMGLPSPLAPWLETSIDPVMVGCTEIGSHRSLEVLRSVFRRACREVAAAAVMPAAGPDASGAIFYPQTPDMLCSSAGGLLVLESPVSIGCTAAAFVHGSTHPLWLPAGEVWEVEEDHPDGGGLGMMTQLLFPSASIEHAPLDAALVWPAAHRDMAVGAAVAASAHVQAWDSVARLHRAAIRFSTHTNTTAAEAAAMDNDADVHSVLNDENVHATALGYEYDADAEFNTEENDDDGGDDYDDDDEDVQFEDEFGNPIGSSNSLGSNEARGDGAPPLPHTQHILTTFLSLCAATSSDEAVRKLTEFHERMTLLGVLTSYGAFCIMHVAINPRLFSYQCCPIRTVVSGFGTECYTRG